VPTYAKVKYEDVYPGVGLVYYGNRGQLEYDFVVEPGADPRAIKLDVAVELAPPTVAPVSPPATGAGDSAATTRALQAAPLRIAANGDLLLKTGGGEIRFQKPVVYQNVAAGLSPADENHKPCPAKAGLYEPPQPCIAAGPASLSTGVAAGSADNPKTAIQNRKYLDGRYVLRGHNQVGFEVAAYDRKQPLIIDPVLIYSTYLGGEQDEGIFGIGFDPHGNIYVAGETSSPNFPIKHAFQSKLGGNYDGFVTEFDRTGTTLIYSTYLGGSNFDHCVGIAVDAEGSVYVAGYTQSTDFPIFHALQSALKGPQNAFVARLAPGGSKLVYSTYLGGSGVDGATGIAIDSSGNAYVAGGTQSTDFPVTPGAFQKLCDQGVNHGQCFGDAFASKLTASGSKLVYSTYLGGNFSDAAIDIAADSTGVAYLTGYTGSTDFPLKNPYQSTLNGMSNVFVTKLNASGAALVYSSYLGGNGFDTAQGIAIDALDNIYLAGTTTSTNFPLMHAFQSENMAQGYDGFASKFNAAGSRLVYSTYLGGTGTNLPWRIAVDSLGHASIIGFTSSADFPVVNAIQPTYAGGPTDAFVTKFGASGASLDYSTYLGGAADEYGYAIHADAAGNVWVGGSTASTDFPIVKPFQGVYGGGPYDAFLSAIAAAPLPSVRVLQGDVQNLTRSGSLSSSQGQALNARLQQAEQDLSQNNSHGAAIEVQDFVQQVKQYVTQGTLAAAVGDGLVTAAQEILGRLG
ncbi:MAG: SBBP repeat-containing protein, partial [Terriglobia bacterium]